jgi:hypothetical protein
MGAMVVHLPMACGASCLIAATECLTGTGIEALEHPNTAEANANKIIV